MGAVSELLGSTVYLDANVIIYAIEGFDRYAQATKRLLRSMQEKEIAVVTCQLTVAEVLVKPKKDNNQSLQQVYLDFLQPSVSLTLAAVDLPVLLDAAEIRATSPLRLPDAIHFATAIKCECDSLLTNDRRFVGIRGMTAFMLDSLASL